MPKTPVDFAGPSYFGGKNDQLVLCAGKGLSFPEKFVQHPLTSSQLETFTSGTGNLAHSCIISAHRPSAAT